MLVAGVAALAGHGDALPLGQRGPGAGATRPPPGIERLPRHGAALGIGAQRPRALEVGVDVADGGVSCTNCIILIASGICAAAVVLLVLFACYFVCAMES